MGTWQGTPLPSTWLSWLPLGQRAELVAGAGLGLFTVLVLATASATGQLELIPAAQKLGAAQSTSHNPSPTTGGRSTPAALSAADRLAAAATVGTAFQACVGKADFSPTGCPQAFPAPSGATSPSWKLVGDPIADAQASAATGSSGAVVVGHYQLLLTYLDAKLNGLQHVAVAGGYRGQLNRAGREFTLSSLVTAAGAQPALRPAGATDDVIKDAVRQAFARCAAAQALAVVDCPMQGSTDSNIRNVAWKLIGDPLAQATVVFDPASGAFAVAGPFTMQADYDATGLISFHHSDPTSGQFRTAVLWDGSAPVVAGIDRVS